MEKTNRTKDEVSWIKALDWAERHFSIYVRPPAEYPSEIPPIPTYREALREMYSNIERSGKTLQRAIDRLRDRAEIAASAPCPGWLREDMFRAAVVAQINADYQMASANKNHWEDMARWYSEKLEACPELADRPLKSFTVKSLDNIETGTI